MTPWCSTRRSSPSCGPTPSGHSPSSVNASVTGSCGSRSSPSPACSSARPTSCTRSRSPGPRRGPVARCPTGRSNCCSAGAASRHQPTSSTRRWPAWPTRSGASATWIGGLGAADRADLRGRCVERVTQFLECFPPLSRSWHPMTEASVQWPKDGPIVLRARVDLVIGKPVGVESRKVLIDLKSGRMVPRYRDDLRFYALVETLAREVPPRSVAVVLAGSRGARRRTCQRGRPALGAATDPRRGLADDRADRRGPPSGRSAELGLLHLPSGVRPVASARCRSDGAPPSRRHQRDGEAEAGFGAHRGDRASRLDGRLGWADQLRPEPLGGHVEILHVEDEAPERGRSRGKPARSTISTISGPRRWKP